METLIQYSVDGAHGQNGQRGQNGRAGKRGQSAGEPSPGQDAGKIELTLLFDASKQQARVIAQAWSGQGNFDWDELCPLDELAVGLRALGGKGGDGGQGGQGGDGNQGRSGRSATRYSVGEDGGDGQDGGDGGPGTHGANGGHGGVILVSCDEAHAFLLMAAPDTANLGHVTAGGPRGLAGRHGLGGAGGPGGRGGSSHTYFVTETVQDQRYNHNTQSYESYSRQVTVSHTNAGGRDGWSGSKGWTPNAPLYPGQSGDNGYGEIVLNTDEGTKRYKQRYELILSDFEIVESPEEYPDGIFEYGEVFLMQRITITNVGGMPSPPFQRVHVIAAKGHWVWPTGSELFLEKSLAPGESIVLSGTLEAQIAMVQIDSPGAPCVVSQDVQPALIQLGTEDEAYGPAHSGFRRRYEQATLTRQLIAQFPLENREGVIGLRSLAAGERTSLSFDVSNISNQPIGQQSERARRVRVLVTLLESELADDAYTLSDHEGHPIGLLSVDEALGEVGYGEDVLLIDSHASQHVKVQFGFALGVPAYSGVRLGWSLWLEDLHQPGQWVVAQRRELTIRSEPAYRYRPESKVVLVTHNNTSQDAFLAWRTLLETQLDLPFDHWSISRYGHFDHQVDLQDETILKTHLEDRLAIVLNQPFSPRGNEDVDMPTDYLRGMDVRDCSTTNNTHYMIVGSDRFDMLQMLEPSSDVRRAGDDYPDITRFLEKEVLSAGPLAQETFKDDITTHMDKVTVKSWTVPFFEPSATAMDEEVESLQDELTAMHPNRRYVLVKHPMAEHKRSGRRWLFFPNWALGHVEVRRTLNTETSSTLILNEQDQNLNNPDFILSEDVRYAVLLSLPFEEKLNKLNWLMQIGAPLQGHHIETARALNMAIMTDLAQEQAALARGTWSLTPEVLRLKLSNLERMLQYPLFTNVDVDSNHWDFLTDLYGSLVALCDVRNPYWKFWGRDRKMKKYLENILNVIESQWFDTHAVDMDGDVAMSRAMAADRIEASQVGWKQIFRARHQQLVQETGLRVSMAFAAQDCFEFPQAIKHDIVRDINVWSDGRDRIWDAEDFKAAQDREANRREKQEQLRQINDETRSKYLMTFEHDEPSTADVVFGFDEKNQQAKVPVVEVVKSSS